MPHSRAPVCRYQLRPTAAAGSQADYNRGSSPAQCMAACSCCHRAWISAGYTCRSGGAHIASFPYAPPPLPASARPPTQKCCTHLVIRCIAVGCRIHVAQGLRMSHQYNLVWQRLKRLQGHGLVSTVVLLLLLLFCHRGVLHSFQLLQCLRLRRQPCCCLLPP